MSTKISLDQLTPEALEALQEQVRLRDQEEEKRIRAERKRYKELVNETVPPLVLALKEASNMLATVKKKVYDELSTLVVLKGEAYGREDDQTSHSFTTDDGLTIIIGHRVNDGWDDTVNTGIQKVHDYLETLGTDKKSKDLVKAITQLLSKDSKGTLKASRVLQLQKIALEMGDLLFIDAIQIIQDAYRPVKSKEFVTCRYTGPKGEKIEVPLDISSVDVPIDDLTKEEAGNAAVDIHED